jgi:transposase
MTPWTTAGCTVTGPPDRAGKDRASSMRPGPRFDRQTYRQCNRVECSVGRLQQSRHIATRYRKLVVNYLAWVALAASLVWL